MMYLLEVKKKLSCFLGMLFLVLIFGSGMEAWGASEIPITINEKEINVPSVSKEYRIVIVNDLHLICPDEQVPEDKKQELNERYTALMVDQSGTPSEENWIQLAEKIQELNPDLVMFAADMVDYVSVSTIEKLKEGCKYIQAPIVYIRSDHDYETKYAKNLESEEAKELQKTVCSDSSIEIYDLGECYVVGINKSHKQISEKKLKKFKKCYKEGKPILLVTHVPIDSRIDSELRKASYETRQKYLLWGEEDFYEPDENTQEFIDLVTADNSPVCAVVAAHLHFGYDAPLTENIKEYIFPPAFQKNLGLITIHR